MAEEEGYFPRSRKIHNIFPKEIRTLDCRSIDTPMDANLKKFRGSASDSNLINPTMYR